MYGPWNSQDNIKGIVGVQPGELVTKEGNASASSNIIYTVPTNLTLFITWFSAAISCNTSGDAGYARIIDASLKLWVYLAFTTGPVDFEECVISALTTPFQVPSGYGIQVVSDVAATPVTLSFQGYLN